MAKACAFNQGFDVLSGPSIMVDPGHLNHAASAWCLPRLSLMAI